MTIKEIEQLSGITRANIRYYETEGFLTPERSENGYRDYSPDDLQTLQRIRLLRSLGMSLEDIKAVQSGRLTLSASLYQLEQDLSQTREQLDWAKETCRLLRQENVTYETLYAPRYFDRLPPAQQDNTAEPPFRGPWRRYFARSLDLFIYQSVINLAAIALFRMSPQRSSDLSMLWTLLSVVTMMILEPMLLYRFGTTFGKWVFGLRITDLDGRLPEYEPLRRRMWGVLWWGFGLIYIPIFNLVRMAISYHDAAGDRDCHWEDETVQVLRKPPKWRYVLAGAIYVALVAAVVLLPQIFG
jgi:DNA-binding transcriptional MerR regulator